MILYVTGHDLYIQKSDQFSCTHFNKKNGITSHYNGQSRTVTSSYKFATPKKDEKANPFDQIILRFKLEAMYSVK